MNPVTAAILKSGAISPAMLEEMRRFNPALKQDVEANPNPVDLETAAELVEQALQSEQYVLVRETDLEIVRRYAETTKTGILHMEINDDQQGDVEVTYGRTPLGEYIIAWRSDSVRDLMTNGLTYLVEDGTRVFFKDVRDLFFGEQKTFMVCVPSSTETHAQ